MQLSICKVISLVKASRFSFVQKGKFVIIMEASAETLRTIYINFVSKIILILICVKIDLAMEVFLFE